MPSSAGKTSPTDSHFFSAGKNLCKATFGAARSLIARISAGSWLQLYVRIEAGQTDFTSPFRPLLVRIVEMEGHESSKFPRRGQVPYRLDLFGQGGRRCTRIACARSSPLMMANVNAINHEDNRRGDVCGVIAGPYRFRGLEARRCVCHCTLPRDAGRRTE